MANKQITLNSVCADGFYRMSFRCLNCGTLFEADIKKGEPAKPESVKKCPYCGITSYKGIESNIEVIRHNDHLDRKVLDGPLIE